MAVTYEMIGTKLMPVVVLGDCDAMVSLCGPNHHTFNGLVISNQPPGRVWHADDLHNPVVIQFRSRYDVEKLIENLEILKRKFNHL